MATYVLASRRRLHNIDRTAAAESADRVFASHFKFGSVVHGQSGKGGALARNVRVFEADPAEIDAKSRDLPPSVILEPLILHMTAGQTRSLSLQVTGDDKPLPGVRVHALFENPGAAPKVTGSTGTDGRAALPLPANTAPHSLLLKPCAKYWSRVAFNPVDGMAIATQPLPNGPIGWWHQVMGVGHYDEHRGEGIRVGVIDGGVGPHSALAHVHSEGTFLNGAAPIPLRDDAGRHGTHVCGLIAARQRSSDDTGFVGIAPGVELYSTRVFGDDAPGANQADIANALDHLTGVVGVHLVNMSLAAESPSLILYEAILDARDQGTLCICAAGNSAGPCEFPAGFTESVAVGAVGLEGWCPNGCSGSHCRPRSQDKGPDGLDPTGSLDDFRLFFATFSCYAPPALDCVGPGVGIIATVPSCPATNDGYADMDGTSMASPLVCGTLATILSKDATYRSYPSSPQRTELARMLLHRHCKSIGMDGRLAGRGIPVAPS